MKGLVSNSGFLREGLFLTIVCGFPNVSMSKLWRSSRDLSGPISPSGPKSAFRSGHSHTARLHVMPVIFIGLTLESEKLGMLENKANETQ